MWALPRILAERYHHTVRVQTCSHACDLSSTCAHVPAGLLHLHALSLRLHTCARVHTHATCARWLENSLLTIACRATPMPGRCVHACLARLLMSSLSCIPAFSPNDERFSRSGFNFPLNITCNKLMHGISCMHQITMSYMASHALHGIPMYCMATEKCCCKSKGLSARDCGQ
jgi:hypothetical protein